MEIGKTSFRIVFCAIALLALVATAHAEIYYGGFEDRIIGGNVAGGSDYDYNDLVFTLSGTGLHLVSATGQWFTKPVLNGAAYPSTGTPFWNNGSQDGANYNVGFCIYGGGNCGAGLDPTALYLATPGGGAPLDVYFTAPANVNNNITIMVTADPTDTLGWEILGDPTLHWFTPGTGSFTFNPGGSPFQILGRSQDVFSGDITTVAAAESFAFFAPVPEPGSIALLGTAVLGLAALLRRKIAR